LKIYTIGFAKKTAQIFFEQLKNTDVKQVIDIRLNNSSQLAGFTKRQDIAYFLPTICNIAYSHKLEFAPTKEILDGYKKHEISWQDYETKFLALLQQRNIALSKNIFHNSCLLCSEATPEHCHRRLVAEYLQKHWNDIEIIHIL